MVRRLPGQSLRDKKEWLTDNWLVPCCFSPLFVWFLWGWELYRLRTHQPPQPNALLGLAIFLTGLSAIALRPLFRRFQSLNRGEVGELKVAEALEELRSAGYRPVHDIVRDKFNIDHVLVGPAGVFAIETKFRSGKGEISFRNGEGLFVGGRAEEKDCLAQARSNAGEVNRLIHETCGRWQWVTPLVVFVGDWRVKDDWRDTNARVLTPNQLVRYLSRRQPELTQSEIKLIASHLEGSATS